jgi:hypothetical protein
MLETLEDDVQNWRDSRSEAAMGVVPVNLVLGDLAEVVNQDIDVAFERRWRIRVVQYDSL